MSPAPAAVAVRAEQQIRDRSRRTWDHAVSVRGGPRGQTAELAELVAAAVALDEAGAALRQARVAASRLVALVEATWEQSPGTAPRAAAAAAALLRPALPAVRDVEDTATGVRAAVRGFVAADGVAEQLVRAVQIVGGHAVGAAGPGGWLLIAGTVVAGAAAAAHRVVTLQLLRRTPSPTGLVLRALGSWADDLRGPAGLLGWLLVGDGGPLPALDPRDARVLQHLLPFVGGFVQGALPGGMTPAGAIAGDLSGQVPVAAGTAGEIGAWLTALRWAARVTPSRVVVARSLAVPPPAAQAPPRTTADLVTGIGRTYPAQPGGPGAAAPGTVEVKQLRREDGTRTWVVTVPGTQEWGPLQRENPFDLPTNLALMARQADDVTAATVRAMELAGIPPGEPVVLAGHSQGGLAATAIAADPALRDRFEVRAVVTAGSPVGHIDLPPGVVAVHLENRTDPVHALDARANPDTPDRTTVRADLAAAPDAAVRAAALTPVGAHDVRTYAEVAAGLEDVDDPRWRAAGAQLEALLEGTTTVETTWFTAVRMPPAPPRSP